MGGKTKKQKQKNNGNSKYTLLISCSKKGFCWKAQSDWFPEKILLPQSQGVKTADPWLDLLVANEQDVTAFTNVDNWVTWQLYDETIASSGPLCEWATRLSDWQLPDPDPGSFRQIQILDAVDSELSNIVGHTYSSHGCTHFCFPISIFLQLRD